MLILLCLLGGVPLIEDTANPRFRSPQRRRFLTRMEQTSKNAELPVVPAVACTAVSHRIGVFIAPCVVAPAANLTAGVHDPLTLRCQCDFKRR